MATTVGEAKLLTKYDDTGNVGKKMNLVAQKSFIASRNKALIK